MDGGTVIAGLKSRMRGSAVLLVSVAMIPAALMAGSAGAADGTVADPALRWSVGSPGMLAAQDIARRNWGMNPCGGQVEIVWSTDDPTINARSYWANPVSSYDHPDLNSQCRIVFNSAMSFSWPKFCTVVVHEYGHLAGRPHGADGGDVMSPIYRAALPACADTPDPADAPAPAFSPRTVVDAPVSESGTATAPAQRPGRRHSRKIRVSRAVKERASKRHRRARARARTAVLKHFTSNDA